MNRKWEIADATRKPYAVRAILLHVLPCIYTAVCFYIIIIAAVVISRRAPLPSKGMVMVMVVGEWSEKAECREINPIQDYDNENIEARRMSSNTLRAHDRRQW